MLSHPGRPVPGCIDIHHQPSSANSKLKLKYNNTGLMVMAELKPVTSNADEDAEKLRLVAVDTVAHTLEDTGRAGLMFCTSSISCFLFFF